MVVFTCNHCGDSLQKPTVEKHYAFVCRTQKFMTCVDCLKDFREEYVTHTKCVTESQRYSAKGSMPDGDVKKGEIKQESWVEMIGTILVKEPNMKPAHRNLVNTILGYSNIPRKKPKFMNFIKSSSGGRVNMKEVEEVWNIIEEYKNKQTLEKEENDKSIKQNTIPNGDEKNQGKTKRKREEEIEGDSLKKIKSMNDPKEVDITANEKFSFKDKIIDLLQAKKTISLKKLEKKIINAYLTHSGETEVTEKISKKFNKKLKKIPNLTIIDNLVALKEVEA